MTVQIRGYPNVPVDSAREHRSRLQSITHPQPRQVAP